jgi:prepilin-type N-terminal cleavage/methylation domain-containing protein
MNARAAQNSRKRSKKRLSLPAGRRAALTGFTLIELVMVVMILAVMSMAGYHLMRFTIQNTFYLPNQLRTSLALADAIETMVEGDSAAVRGLRFSKSVTAAAANQIDVIDQDDVALRFRLDTGTGRLYRKIGAAAEEVIPYFMPSGVSFAGSGGSVFTYLDANEAVTADPASVRRVGIDLIAQQGVGSVDRYEGISRQSTSIKMNKYL